MNKPSIPFGHFPRLPWRIDPESPHQILDSAGVPVAWGSSTTSLISRETDERGVTSASFRTTETVNAIRAKIIVDAVNHVHTKEA